MSPIWYSLRQNYKDAEALPETKELIELIELIERVGIIYEGITFKWKSTS